LLSASRKRLEAARVYAVAARISTFATTFCGAEMAYGVATIPSTRPNGAPSELLDQLSPAVQSSSAWGVNLQHFGEEIRSEKDSIWLALAGIIATRAESAEAA
jgi:hypothetical protein|tara:strand:- start:2509 stop:2817 length:309 start_codon:yes stop_codon:yes gene_type:complete